MWKELQSASAHIATTPLQLSMCKDDLSCHLVVESCYCSLGSILIFKGDDVETLYVDWFWPWCRRAAMVWNTTGHVNHPIFPAAAG